MNIFKKALRIVITTGSATVMGNIASEATKDSNALIRTCANVASWAIGAYVGDKAADYIDDSIDEIESKVKALRLTSGGEKD